MITNIKKIAVMGASFLAVFSIVLAGMIPVHASSLSGAINPNDYIFNITVDGDVKRVTFDFSSITPRYVLWEYYKDETTPKKTVSSGLLSMYQIDSDLQRVYSMSFPLGVETYKESFSGPGGIDVSDISHGAELTLSASWDFITTLVSNGFVSGNNGEKAAVLIVRSYAMLFDGNGKYLSSVQGSSNNVDLPNRGGYSETVDINSTVVVPSGCSYIVPFYEVQITDFLLASSQWRVSLRNASFGFSCDINMIYENSQTMNDIKDALGDVSQGIQDTNDKLDDTNDKLDTIIDGTSEQQGIAAEKSDEAANMRDQVQDMVGQKDSVVKPDPADIDMDISDVLDNDSVSMLTSSVAPIYDIPIVTNYFAVFGSILVVSFILFGKKR